jgi:hypothetical protein
VLRRSVGVDRPDRVLAAGGVHRQAALAASGHPHAPPAGGEADVVNSERRRDVAGHTRVRRITRDVDHDDALGRRAERDPQRPAARVERDVAGERADGHAPQDAGPDQVDDGELAGVRVGDVGVAAVGRDRRVARLGEAAQDDDGRPSDVRTVVEHVGADRVALLARQGR